MNRSRYGALLLLSACIALSWLFCPLYEPVVGDQEIFRYFGLAIGRGCIPYRDFFDHKPPGIFFLNFIGLIAGPWGLWLTDSLLMLLITFLFYDLGRQYRLPCPWLLPLLFNLMMRDNLLTEVVGSTREYTTIFLLAFFCVLLGKYRYRYFLLGLLTGLIFFMQQEQVLSLLPFLSCAFLFQDAVPVSARFVRVGAGFLTIALPLVLYFAFHRSLDLFWQDAFAFNFSWYTAEKKSWWDHFRNTKKVLDAGNYEMVFMIAIILGVGSFFMKNKKKGLVLAALLTVLLSLSAEYLSGKLPGDGTFSYYFRPLAASLTILLFTVFAFTEEAFLSGRRSQAIYGFLLCCSLVYTAVQHAAHLPRRDQDPVVKSPELNYLRQRRPKDFQLYVFGNNDYIYAYNELKIRAPTPWIYHQFWLWYDRWDADQHLLQSIGQDLLRHRTTYILTDFSVVDRFPDAANAAWWKTFLMTHYTQVPLPGDTASMLWEIKDP